MIWLGYRNTVLYTIFGTAFSLLFTLPAAYALSRKDFKGRNAIMMYFVFTMFFGGGLIPTYLTVRNFHLLNTVWVLLIPFSVSVYNMIISRTFFSANIPLELLEAAKLDGCSNTRFFVSGVLPLSKAIVAVISLYYAVGQWNQFFSSLVYVRDAELMPLQLVLRNILLQNQIYEVSMVDPFNEAARVAEAMKYSLIIVATLPVMCFYPLIQKYFTKGVMIGAIKHDQTPDYNTLEIFQKLEQKTGVHINWEYAGADWSTQKPLVLASGDLPDAFMSQTLGEGDVTQNIELFLPLDDLIGSYETYVQAMFKDDPDMENYARFLDGKIYGLPRKLPLQPDTYTVWGINQSWLDKLGLKMPATTEEFYQVLKAFKTQDPNGSGIADEIPLSCRWSTDASGNRNFKDIFGAFGVDIGYNNWLSVTNGKVQYAPV